MHPLIQRAQTEGTPLKSEETALFIWQGDNPPLLLCDLFDWYQNPQTLEQIEPGLWGLEVHLPADAYVEYAFWYEGDQQHTPDPFNPTRLNNGFNKYNHWFYMPNAPQNPLVVSQSNVRRGKLTRHEVETREMAAGKTRSVYLYQPPTHEPVPLLVVYDGPDYFRRGKLVTIVENLMAQQRIRPIALAMLQNGGQARLIEYGCSDLTLGFVLDAVIPLAQEHLNLLDVAVNPGAYGILGASMGGLMALYTGLRMPHIFGKVISQSGAFRIEQHEFVTSDLVRFGPRLPLQIWLDVGLFESLLDCNREMRDLLEQRGYQPRYREYSGGHNYTAWRNDVWRGLEIMFGIS